jgi:hypothetical protein
MTVRIQIRREGLDSWGVYGLSSEPAAHFRSLAASIDHARRRCAAAPATVELMVDGFYAVMHQTEGWPRPIIAPRPPYSEFPTGFPSSGQASFRRWFSRLLSGMLMTPFRRAGRGRPEASPALLRNRPGAEPASGVVAAKRSQSAVRIILVPTGSAENRQAVEAGPTASSARRCRARQGLNPALW